MTDKPTGVFMRLPLSEEQRNKVTAEMMFAGIPVADAFENALLAIGTPVTGGELEVVGCIAPKQAETAEKGGGLILRLYPKGRGGKTWTVNLTRHDKALALLAARDAEIARLREIITIAQTSISRGKPMKAAYALEEALKGGAA